MVFLQLKSLLWTVIHHNHSRQSTFAFPNNFICYLSSKKLFFYHILAICADGFFSCILRPTFMAAFHVLYLLKWCQRPLVKYLYQFSLNGYMHGSGHLWNSLFKPVKQEIYKDFIQKTVQLEDTCFNKYFMKKCLQMRGIYSMAHKKQRRNW